MMVASAEKQQYYLLKGVNKAIRDYAMIADGDRVAVAVSGGKDSLALLKLLCVRRDLVRQEYDLVAIHVLPDEDTCGGGASHNAVADYCRDLGVPLEVVPMEAATGEPRRKNQSPCFYCAWRRRKAIFGIAQRLGCPRAAFGHHADDLAQTTLLNLLFHGRAETMEPKVAFFGGKLDLIRPLAYVRESEIARYARAAELPVVEQVCAGAEESQRRFARRIIAEAMRVSPYVRKNLVRAGLRPRDEADAKAVGDEG